MMKISSNQNILQALKFVPGQTKFRLDREMKISSKFLAFLWTPDKRGRPVSNLNYLAFVETDSFISMLSFFDWSLQALEKTNSLKSLRH